jgi:hypothetical protein
VDDLAPSAVTPASKWEKAPSHDERKSRKHRAPVEKPPENDEAGPFEEVEPHNLDELA